MNASMKRCLAHCAPPAKRSKNGKRTTTGAGRIQRWETDPNGILAKKWTKWSPKAKELTPRVPRNAGRNLGLRSPPTPRRFGIRQHLRNSISADPKIPNNLTPTQPVLQLSVTNLQMQIHGEYPQAHPTNERAKLADFYDARDHTTPALPSPSIAPPFTARTGEHLSATTALRSRFCGPLSLRILNASLAPANGWPITTPSTRTRHTVS